MTPFYLQEDLMKELEIIFSGMSLCNPKGELAKMNIFSQNLPVPSSSKQEDFSDEVLESGIVTIETEENPYPYTIVEILDGTIADINAEQTANIVLIFGIYDNDERKQGHKDILNLISRVYERFAKNPILANRYSIKAPIEWTLTEEDYYPYYFGGMQLQFEMAGIRREDELI